MTAAPDLYIVREELLDDLAQARLDYSNLETRIYLGESGLALRREQVERRIKLLVRRIAEERAGQCHE